MSAMDKTNEQEIALATCWVGEVTNAVERIDDYLFRKCYEPPYSFPGCMRQEGELTRNFNAHLELLARAMELLASRLRDAKFERPDAESPSDYRLCLFEAMLRSPDFDLEGALRAIGLRPLQMQITELRRRNAVRSRQRQKSRYTGRKTA